ncbi:MAG: hypothetical protein JSW11_18975 [Candidatus Heimdallarchaeota archaeon]|nr:MAG: hypothetical protein JSW11_18975 [Candidatus Heimdallarchaeota archaeon]
MDRHLFFEYLNSITAFLESNYRDNLISIVLFGSLVNRNVRITISTDADLLVILHDSCTSRDFKRIKRNLIEIESSLLPHLSAHESLFIRSLQSATGMFCNFFICRFSDFKRRNFNRVFNVNSFMGALLAPQNSVWLSLLSQHRILWGENVFREWETFPIITKYDLLRSFLMNCLLALGALFLYPLHPQITKFSMEAMKWSLFTWKNIYSDPSLPLNEIITRFVVYTSELEQRALHDFVEYRKHKKPSKFFPLLAWIFAFQLHRSIFQTMAEKSLEF